MKLLTAAVLVHCFLGVFLKDPVELKTVPDTCMLCAKADKIEMETLVYGNEYKGTLTNDDYKNQLMTLFIPDELSYTPTKLSSICVIKVGDCSPSEFRGSISAYIMEGGINNRRAKLKIFLQKLGPYHIKVRAYAHDLSPSCEALDLKKTLICSPFMWFKKS